MNDHALEAAGRRDESAELCQRRPALHVRQRLGWRGGLGGLRFVAHSVLVGGGLLHDERSPLLAEPSTPASRMVFEARRRDGRRQPAQKRQRVEVDGDGAIG
jgi:hypothetical protein